jgi:hypothetical protein
MTTIINGSSPSITFSDSTTQTTAFNGQALSASPYTTSLGASTLVNNTGTANTAIGNGALAANTTASYNTAVGYQAGYSGTTNGYITALGYQAAYTANTDILAIGHQAGFSNTTGSGNTAIGSYQTLYTNTTGSQNTAIGRNAMTLNTTGSYNCALGFQALTANTTATYNTAVGYQAGQNCTTNGANTLVGATCGTTLTTGTNNTYFGAGATASGATVAQEIIICAGNGATGKGANTGFISPNSGAVYQGNNSASWSTTSDQRLKKNIVDNTVGLSAINAIQVRNFEYRTADEVTDLPKEQAIGIKGVQLGAIAQELAQVLPDCVKTESTGVMSVNTDNLTWYLINAVKELNAKVTALEAQLQGK